jgi:hypothetical protein
MWQHLASLRLRHLIECMLSMTTPLCAMLIRPMPCERQTKQSLPFCFQHLILCRLYFSQRYSVSVVQHVLLLHSLLPPTSLPPSLHSSVSLLQPHQVELQYIFRKESLEHLSRYMSLQLKSLLLDASRDLLLAFSKKSADLL